MLQPTPPPHRLRAWPVAAAVLLLHATAAIAGDPAKPAPRCDARLPAAAQPQPLSKALQRLAQAHPFHLEYWTAEDPPVTQPAGRPVELVAALAQQANVMVRYARHPTCPGQLRIDTVWVLPAGTPSAPLVAKPAAAAAKPSAADPALDAYMRAHGFGETPPAPAR